MFEWFTSTTAIKQITFLALKYSTVTLNKRLQILLAGFFLQVNFKTNIVHFISYWKKVYHPLTSILFKLINISWRATSDVKFNFLKRLMVKNFNSQASYIIKYLFYFINLIDIVNKKILLKILYIYILYYMYTSKKMF